MNNLLNTAHNRPDLLQNVHAVDVTPALAERLLLNNTHNRNFKPRDVLRYVADMEQGEWQWNGGTICIADDGTLLDGQNRLRAVIDSDATVPMLIVVGLPLKAQRDMDTGVSRRLADVLTLNGETNAASLAALVRICYIWDRGGRQYTGGGISPSIAQGLAFLDAHPETRDIVNDSRRVADGCGIPASVIGLCWWIFDQVADDEPNDVTFFFDRLADGQGLVQGDPLYALRRAVADNNQSVRGERNRTWMTALVIKAWNAYRKGEKVSLLRWKSGGAKPESFPEPR